MSLIDRKQVMECLTKEYNRRFMQGDRDGLKLAWIEKAVDDAPEVDAEPVRHGRWTADESTYTDGEAQCSVCKTTFYVDDLYCVGEKAQSELPKYCPHCGAKMDGEHETD